MPLSRRYRNRINLAFSVLCFFCLAADTGFKYGDLVLSHIPRDSTAPAITLSQEISLGAQLPSGYRGVPRIIQDGDSIGGGTITFATRPLVACGTTQNTVEARIADCAEKNTAPTWNGPTLSNAGHGIWKLVTYNSTHEVWRDERTHLLWSDYLGQENWCQATGSSGGGPFPEVDPSGTCDDPAHQDQTTPLSWCFEHAGLDTSPAYDSMKGGMKRASSATSPSVIWRLPTYYDLAQAQANGMHYVLPNLGGPIWSATFDSTGNHRGWVYYGAPNNVVGQRNRQLSATGIRCVGR